jgi:hypothetical protein
VERSHSDPAQIASRRTTRRGRGQRRRSTESQFPRGARVVCRCWHSQEARGVLGRRASASPGRAEGEQQPSKKREQIDDNDDASSGAQPEHEQRKKRERNTNDSEDDKRAEDTSDDATIEEAEEKRWHRSCYR